MATGSVPVREELGSEGDADVEIFGDSMEQVASHPKVVTNRDTLAGANLKFPLAWHNFRVRARNFDSSKEASFVVHISDCTAKADVGAD